MCDIIFICITHTLLGWGYSLKERNFLICDFMICWIRNGDSLGEYFNLCTTIVLGIRIRIITQKLSERKMDLINCKLWVEMSFCLCSAGGNVWKFWKKKNLIRYKCNEDLYALSNSKYWIRYRYMVKEG